MLLQMPLRNIKFPRSIFDHRFWSQFVSHRAQWTWHQRAGAKNPRSHVSVSIMCPHNFSCMSHGCSIRLGIGKVWGCVGTWSSLTCSLGSSQSPSLVTLVPQRVCPVCTGVWDGWSDNQCYITSAVRGFIVVSDCVYSFLRFKCEPMGARVG